MVLSCPRHYGIGTTISSPRTATSKPDNAAKSWTAAIQQLRQVPHSDTGDYLKIKTVVPQVSVLRIRQFRIHSIIIDDCLMMSTWLCPAAVLLIFVSWLMCVLPWWHDHTGRLNQSCQCKQHDLWDFFESTNASPWSNLYRKSTTIARICIFIVYIECVIYLSRGWLFLP